MRSRRIAAGFATGLALALPATAAAEPPAGYQGGPTHSGFVDAAVAPPLGKRWARADLGRPSQPILYAGRVLVTATAGDSSGGTTSLHALDAATGRTLWSVPGVGGRVSAAAGLVITRVRDQIVARDIGSGAVRWTTGGGDDDLDVIEPVADDALVFTGGPGITAYRTADGLRVWEASSSNSRTGMPAADGERAYVLGCGGGVLAAQRDVGVPVWEASGDCSGGSSPAPAVVAQGRVWGEEGVHRAADGVALGPWTGGQPAVAQDRTVAAVGSGLQARDFEGRALWEVGPPSAESYSDSAYGQPLIVGSTVYALAEPDLVVGHDLGTGREVWRSTTRLGDSISSSDSVAQGLAARGDRLIVPFGDKLVAYGTGADSPGVDPDPWRDPSAVQLGLGRAADATLLFGQGTRMQLSYKRTIGYDEGGLDLVLQADPFPFGTWADVRKVTSDEAEYQGIGVEPDRNTRYRLRYGGVTPPKLSEERAVRVDVNLRVRYRYLSRTRLRARVTLKAPADRLVRPRLKLPFYYFTKRTNRSRRLGIERLRRTGPTTARGTIVLRVPARFGRRDSVYPCLPEKRDDGFGRFLPGQRLCGRKRF